MPPMLILQELKLNGGRKSDGTSYVPLRHNRLDSCCGGASSWRRKRRRRKRRRRILGGREGEYHKHKVGREGVRVAGWGGVKGGHAEEHLGEGSMWVDDEEEQDKS